MTQVRKNPAEFLVSRTPGARTRRKTGTKSRTPQVLPSATSSAVGMGHLSAQKLPIFVGYDAMERSPTFSGGRGALVDRRRPDRGASPFRPRTTERGGKSWPPERGSLVLFYACKIKEEKKKKKEQLFRSVVTLFSPRDLMT